MKFVLYLCRWQLSSPILALVVMNINNVILATMLANLIGGSMFYLVDKKIFNK